MNQKTGIRSLQRLKVLNLLALMVASTCFVAGMPAKASMICGKAGSIDWRANGKRVSDYYGLSNFALTSTLAISQPKKTVHGLTSRKSGGAIIFVDNKGRYVVSLKLTGTGEGAVASLIDNGVSTGCGLY